MKIDSSVQLHSMGTFTYLYKSYALWILNALRTTNRQEIFSNAKGWSSFRDRCKLSRETYTKCITVTSFRDYNPSTKVLTQNFVRPRKGDGPFLEAARQLLAGDVPLQIPGHRPGDHERENVSVSTVVQTCHPVQQRHDGAGSPRRLRQHILTLH